MVHAILLFRLSSSCIPSNGLFCGTASAFTRRGKGPYDFEGFLVYVGTDPLRHSDRHAAVVASAIAEVELGWPANAAGSFGWELSERVDTGRMAGEQTAPWLHDHRVGLSRSKH